jgi:hypothetical protein
MLSKLKIILVSLLAVFTLAVAASTASAAEPSWHVNGTKVAAGAKFTIALGAAVAAGNHLTYDHGEAELSCTGVDIESGWIEGEKAGGAEHVELTGCTVNKPAHCALAGGKLVTPEMRAELLSGEPARVTFKPLHGTVFSEIKLENSGGTCALNGKTFKMTGSITGTVVNPLEEAILKEINVETGAGELEVNGEEARLTALVSGKLLLGFKCGVF